MKKVAPKKQPVQDLGRTISIIGQKEYKKQEIAKKLAGVRA